MLKLGLHVNPLEANGCDGNETVFRGSGTSANFDLDLDMTLNSFR